MNHRYVPAPINARANSAHRASIFTSSRTCSNQSRSSVIQIRTVTARREIQRRGEPDRRISRIAYRKNVSHVIYPSGSRQWLSEPSSYCSPLAAVLLPLFHYFPQLRRWRVRSRVYRWYGELALLERDVAARMETLPTEKWLADLERIERAVARINTPAGFASEAYTLREHIVLVRRAIIARNSLLPNTSRLGKISSTQR